MGTTSQPWVQTRSGRIFNPLLPDPSDITIGDIAFALGNLTRFTGHCPFYSVAQHSVFVSYLVDPQYQREALLHDASEAYLNDINSPVKSLVELTGYRDVEDELSRNIMRKFGASEEEIDEVKDADRKAFRMEVIKFFPYNSPLWRKYVKNPKEYQTSKVRIGAYVNGEWHTRLNPEDAYQLFLARYHELFEEPLSGDVIAVEKPPDEPEIALQGKTSEEEEEEDD